MPVGFEDRFDHVFEPFTFGPVTVKNRIEMAPACYNMGLYDGEGTEAMVAYYETLAKSGASIVTIGETPINETTASTFRPCLNLGSERAVHYLFRINEAVARYGAKLSVELQHGGREVRGDHRNIAPSVIYDDNELMAAKREGRQRRNLIEMDQAMIDQTIGEYVAAAERCQKAGLEMAMIHGAHGNLLSQFLSPASNHRTDNYGGSLENRARFVVELLSAIREKVGRRFGIEYRISADEIIDGGMHVDETVEFIHMIEDKIDLLHVSAGSFCSADASRYMIQPMYLPHCTNVHFAEEVKKRVDVPVVTVGSIMTIAEAEEILASGKADMVAMARAIMAGGSTVDDARLGHPEKTRPCLRCWECNRHSGMGVPVRCAVNPKLGKEALMQRIPARAEKGSVLIIGGGPAGMQAALTAAERGCRATILEREDHLGGKLVLAAGVRYKQDIRAYLHWLIRQVSENPMIEVVLNTTATRELVERMQPEALIVAAGAEPVIPRLTGSELNNVVWFGDVDTGKAAVGDRIVLLGGGPSGAETALQLARDGKKVTIVDRGGEGRAKARWIKGLDIELDDNGVEYCFDSTLESVNEGGAVIMDHGWHLHEIEADTIILSTGFRSNASLAEELMGVVPDVYVVGDCGKVANITQAVHDGFNAGTLL